MTRTELMALMAGSIYAGALSMTMDDAVQDAQLLLETVERKYVPLEDPEAEPAESSGMAQHDPFFVIHADTCRAISNRGVEPDLPEGWTTAGNLSVREALEEIHAAMFSGDTFDAVDAIVYLEWYLGRWIREIKNKRQLLEGVPAIAPSVPAPVEPCAICGDRGHDAQHCVNDIPF